MEYACRWTGADLVLGRDLYVLKLDYAGRGERGLAAARAMEKNHRAWQEENNLPADAVVVYRTVPDWAELPEGEDGRGDAGLVVVSADLLDDLTDSDECWFDHHGGCQAHGFLSLEAGERCPNAVAREMLAAVPERSEDV
jgi:hypothetical protein